ncbi:MAG: hypothetical protein HYZ63_02130 [Candidatus Andersenbacteria bacterium]|nr:hypothetical protein [Candidatus Andersenbacteria bacterium]
MRKVYIWVGVLMAVVLALLAWERTSLGNLGIRRVEQTGVRVNLEVAEPVLPGVQTAVHWKQPAGVASDNVIFEVRTSQDTFFVGQGRLADGSAVVLFPCTISEAEVGLSLLEAGTSQVLGTTLVKVLPAGPDCL